MIFKYYPLVTTRGYAFRCGQNSDFSGPISKEAALIANREGQPFCYKQIYLKILDHYEFLSETQLQQTLILHRVRSNHRNNRCSHCKTLHTRIRSHILKNRMKLVRFTTLYIRFLSDLIQDFSHWKMLSPFFLPTLSYIPGFWRPWRSQICSMCSL